MSKQEIAKIIPVHIKRVTALPPMANHIGTANDSKIFVDVSTGDTYLEDHSGRIYRYNVTPVTHAIDDWERVLSADA